MAATTSVQAGLRARELRKDTYERLHCAGCGERLVRRAEPAAPDRVFACPACSRAWHDV